MYNARFEIMDMVQTSENEGYAWAQTETQLVTWYFRKDESGTVDFHNGHYFRKDPDAPARSKAACLEDFYERISNAFGFFAKFGC